MTREMLPADWKGSSERPDVDAPASAAQGKLLMNFLEEFSSVHGLLFSAKHCGLNTSLQLLRAMPQVVVIHKVNGGARPQLGMSLRGQFHQLIHQLLSSSGAPQHAPHARVPGAVARAVAQSQVRPPAIPPLEMDIKVIHTVNREG
jgi:hypothetical protein